MNKIHSKLLVPLKNSFIISEINVKLLEKLLGLLLSFFKEIFLFSISYVSRFFFYSLILNF